jgi:hypothetical protein
MPRKTQQWLTSLEFDPQTASGVENKQLDVIESAVRTASLKGE